LKRRGKLFAHRYHSRYLKTPREVRNVLRYVLLNRKHHAAEKKFSKSWIDPYSSAHKLHSADARAKAPTGIKGQIGGSRSVHARQRELAGCRAPITLLELWLRARGDQLVVDCPPGSWRRRNVEVVCERFAIALVSSWNDFVATVRGSLSGS